MASGGLLVQITLQTQPLVSDAPFYGQQVFGLTTADTDIGPVSIDGGRNTITFKSGWITGDLTASNSADISQGKGFFASVIEGELSIADYTGSATSISEMMSQGALYLEGATVLIAETSSGSTPAPQRLVELYVSEPMIDAGFIRLGLVSRSALVSQKLFKSIQVDQILSDPTDPQKPTNPANFIHSSATKFVGIAYGDQASVKCAETLPVNKLCWYGETTYKIGDIAGGATSSADVAETVCTLIGSKTGTPFPGYPTPSVPGLFVMMRDVATCHDFSATLTGYRANGYKIILSDGSWSLDLDSYEAYNGYLEYNFLIYVTSGGAHYGNGGYHSVGGPAYENQVFWFNVYDSNGASMLPPAGIVASEVSVYAVPKTIYALGQQAILNGIAVNDKTAKIAAETQYTNGAQAILIQQGTTDSIIAMDYIKDLKIAFSDVFAPGTHYLGAIEDASTVVGTVTLSGAGNIQDIVTDPTVGWNGGTVPIVFNANMFSLDDMDLYIRINARLTSNEADWDSYFVDSTFTASFSSTVIGDGLIGAVGPCEPSTVSTFPHPGGLLYQIKKVANRSPGFIRFRSTAKSLADLNTAGYPHPAIRWLTTNGILRSNTVQLEVMETFVWGYSRVDLSEVYATVHPFWTNGKCSALAVDDTTQSILCDSGLGAIDANHDISWTPITIPTLNGGSALITGAACHEGVEYLLVGKESTGSGYTYWSGFDPTFELIPGTFAGTGNATRCRRVGGKFVVVFDDGTLQTATGISSWTVSGLALGFPLYDVSYNDGTWCIVGANGNIYLTTDFVTFDSVGPGGTGNDLLSTTYFQGRFYAGGLSGTIYRATPAEAAAGTWTSVNIGGSGRGDVVDFAATATSIVAVVPQTLTSTTHGIFASDTGASWILRVSSDLSGETTYAHGWRGGVVVSTDSLGAPTWIYGGDSQIITSTDIDQGSTTYAPTWIRGNCVSPGSAIDAMRGKYLGGLGYVYNPLQWSIGGGQFYADQEAFGIGYDPPTSSTEGGTSVDQAIAKICEERWIFAGEMSAVTLDGSSDVVDIGLPVVKMGSIKDVATMIAVQYNKIGGGYVSNAYIQNVDKTFDSANESFFFSGWGSSSNGLALWDICHNVYVRTGILRQVDLTYDSVSDGATLYALWTRSDADLGKRIDWLVSRPQYLEIAVSGNDSAAAQAFTGCRYKINQTYLQARGILLPDYGIVTSADHNYMTGTHNLQIAFAPSNAYTIFDGGLVASNIGDYLLDGGVGAADPDFTYDYGVGP